MDPGGLARTDSTMMEDACATLEMTSPPDIESSLPPDSSDEQPAPDVQPESIVEAVLLSTDDPLSAGSIAEIAGLSTSEVKAAVEKLNERYEEVGASFRVEAIAKGYQILTLPVFDQWLAKLHKKRADSRLSPAALETLAIVAYKQPIMRADIEAVRGVAVGDMLVRLRDANLVRIVGRAEVVGRPLLYGTTTRFLEVFGLSSLKDLPKIEDDQPVPPLRVVTPE
jgi:segregation and condensation protein B